MFHRYAQFQSFQSFNLPHRHYNVPGSNRSRRSSGSNRFNRFGNRDRHRYLHWVFEAKKGFGLCVLDYMVTSNHVHLLVKDTGPDVIARSMQLHSVGHGIIMTP
jgi:hypothetical protein